LLELQRAMPAAIINAMPLFDPPVPRHLLWPKNALWPRRRARALLARFQVAFPELVYDFEFETDIANAQAFLEGKARRVRIFGGLSRHRNIGLAGLSVALAHETGHHLGGAPYLRNYRWLSSEERATEWALAEGLPRIFGNTAGLRIASTGLAQLQRIGSHHKA